MVATKKAREREIFDEVYAHRNLSDIDPHEPPDFLVRNHPRFKRFGVEVTEFYVSESDARLLRIDGYFSDLLDGGDVRHKDDRDRLQVSRGTLRSATGEVKATNVPCIIREMPSRADCARLVADIIRKKERAIDAAPRDLTHINLIIRDRTSILSHVPSVSFYPLFCTKDVRSAVFGSRFREIYFVTTFKNGEAYVPLKMLMMVAQAYLLDGFLVERKKKRFETNNAFMRWIAYYLSTITTGEVRIRERGDVVEVLYGDAGLIVNEANGLDIRQHCDFVPDGAVPVTTDEAWDDLGARAGMPDCEQSNVFECGIAFAVRTGAYLEIDDEDIPQPRER